MKTWKSRGVFVGLLFIAAFGYLSSGSAGEEKTIQQMITAANTPADHQAVASSYREEGTRLQKEAARHAELGQWWANLAGGESFGSARYEQAEHCRRFADLMEKAAKEAQALAKGHDSIAQSVAGSRK
jgi:hypothetical protein